MKTMDSGHYDGSNLTIIFGVFIGVIGALTDNAALFGLGLIKVIVYAALGGAVSHYVKLFLERRKPKKRK